MSQVSGRAEGPSRRGGHFGAGDGIAAAALLFLFVFGGSSQLGPMLRLVAIAIGLIFMGRAIYRFDGRGFFAEDPAAAWLLIALVLLFAVQLVPLSGSMWGGLPGRDVVVRGDQLMFGMLPRRPITLDPDATIAAGVFLFVPIGLYLHLRAGRGGRLRRFFATFLLFAALSVALGIVQALGGHALHLYQNSQSTLPTGFFANRNHQASMLACAIPVCAAWLAVDGRLDRLVRRLGLPPRWGARAIRGAAFAVLALGVLLTGSRTASLLLLPAIAGALLVGPGVRGISARALAIGGAAIAIVVVGVILLPQMGGPLGAIFNRSISGDEDRFRYWPAVVETARAFLPIGSGFGTFDRVFLIHEPVALLAPLTLNHAHNDWLELAVEGGVPGLVLAALFVAWVASKCRAIWTSAAPDAPFARAGSLVILLLLLHSLVDYPLRTTALALLFAGAVRAVAGGTRSKSTIWFARPESSTTQVLDPAGERYGV